MRVSVAMATYNGAAYLEEQLDSILAQLGPEDELVISDDGSTDGTMAILEAAAADERVKLFDGPGLGAVANFECALTACKGQYLVLCDQDDVWEPDKLQTILDTFASTDCAVVLHDARVIDAQGHTIHPSFFALRKTKTGFWKNLMKNSYIGCCMAFSRRLLPYILPFPHSIPMHDQWIGLQGERHGGTVLIHRSLTAYRRHGGNVSADTHASLGAMLRFRVGMIRALLGRR